MRSRPPRPCSKRLFPIQHSSRKSTIFEAESDIGGTFRYRSYSKCDAGLVQAAHLVLRLSSPARTQGPSHPRRIRSISRGLHDTLQAQTAMRLSNEDKGHQVGQGRRRPPLALSFLDADNKDAPDRSELSRTLCVCSGLHVTSRDSKHPWLARYHRRRFSSSQSRWVQPRSSPPASPNPSPMQQTPPRS